MNIEHLIDPDNPEALQEAMNFCPLCDDPVQVHEEAVIVEGWGLKTLAHNHCVEDRELG